MWPNPALRLAALWLASWLVLWWPAPASAARDDHVTGVASGVVVRVVDGDTLWLKVGAARRPLKLRIAAIDAPEICQPGGATARDILRYRLLGKAVVASLHARDDYGRLVAVVYWQGEDIGRWLVSIGQAWSYRYRDAPALYAAEEARARLLRRGLFGAQSAETPQNFRRRHGSCRPRDPKARVLQRSAWCPMVSVVPIG